MWKSCCFSHFYCHHLLIVHWIFGGVFLFFHFLYFFLSELSKVLNFPPKNLPFDSYLVFFRYPFVICGWLSFFLEFLSLRKTLTLMFCFIWYLQLWEILCVGYAELFLDWIELKKKDVCFWGNGWEEICCMLFAFGDFGVDAFSFCCTAFRWS